MLVCQVLAKGGADCAQSALIHNVRPARGTTEPRKTLANSGWLTIRTSQHAGARKMTGKKSVGDEKRKREKIKKRGPNKVGRSIHSLGCINSAREA